MSNKNPVHYFVEGKCEEKFINAFKIAPDFLFVPGKVEVFNFIIKEITNSRIALLKPNSTIILVYDIDVNKTDILKININKLCKFGFKRIYHIQSINNFEDEIVFSSNINNVNDIFNTESIEEFKTMFIKHKNIAIKLKSIEFDFDKMWSRQNTKSPFNIYYSDKASKYIKNKL